MLGLAVAAPQGYNYQSVQLQLPGIPASLDEQRIVQQALQAPKLQQIFGQPTQTQTIFQQQQQLIPQQQQQQVLPQQQHQLVLPQQQQQLLPQQNFAFNSLPQQQFQQQTYNPSAGASLVSKDIYVHVPPVDDAEERYPQPQLPVPPPRKHYRIVFIKAPTPAVSKAALRVKQAPVEEKTIIYVLTKKPDPIDLQTAIEEAAPKQISKPEVFFIKYKTQEEAAHAQRTIQGEYEARRDNEAELAGAKSASR